MTAPNDLAADMPPPLPSDAQQPARRRWSVTKTLLATVAGIALCGLALVAFTMATTTFEVTPAQRAAMHTVADLTEWYEVDVDPAHETWLGERYLDGTWEASYTYERADGEPPFLYAMLGNESTRFAAKARVAVQWQAFQVGVRFGGEGVTVEEATDAAQLGDAPRVGHLVHEGRRIGVLACVAQGRHIYLLNVTTGSDCVEDIGDLRAFFAPKLAAMRADDLMGR